MRSSRTYRLLGCFADTSPLAKLHRCYGSTSHGATATHRTVQAAEAAAHATEQLRFYQ